jgi:hypothetical protein
MLKKRIEKKIDFFRIQIKKESIAVPGKKFLCIKNVIMNGTKEIAYTKGKVYYSEMKGNLTDNSGSVDHGTPNEFLLEYFKINSNN